MESVIVIGAGAAGLMAAYELSKKGKQVIILEAANRLGGRIHTLVDSSFSQPVELGAEFIHGDLELTLSLLKEAHTDYHAITGKMLRLEKGKFKKENDDPDHWGELMERMRELKEDLPLSQFLRRYFNDEAYAGLRESAKGFAEGFDLADPSDASTIALYNEWKEEWGHQYRIDGGYQQLIDHLALQCKKNGCVIHRNCCVKKITWEKNEIRILTMCSQYFEGNKIIITVPVSALQADENDLWYIEFAPAIPQYTEAAKHIGFGTVIKIILQFSDSFWSEAKKDAGFILTGEKIPTWWTQLPQKDPILTGWFGGPKAAAFKSATDEEILEAALQSLASAFAKPIDFIKNKLQAHKLANWSNVPNISGGYSYNKPGSYEAKKLFGQPIEETIFFAGEAFFRGDTSGTVEAALISGREAALRVLQQ